MYQTTHALPAHTCAEVIKSLNARLAYSMDFMHQAKKRRMRTSAVASLLTRRRGRATAAAAGAFGLILLAAPCDAQTVPAVGAEAPVSGLLPAKVLATGGPAPAGLTPEEKRAHVFQRGR